MTQVTFKSSRGIELTVLLGDGSPVLSNGTVTWDTVARPKRTSLTRFSGRTPFNQDLPVMFDGYLDHESQEGRIAKLVRMGSEPNTIKLSGQALRTDLDWVIQGIDWDQQEVIWERIGKATVRTRQAAVVHLLEHISDTVIDTPATPKVQKNKPTKKVPVAKGMSIRKIAQIEYGDPSKWVIIRNANAILIGAGPRYVVPAGTLLTIPEPDGTDVLFTVP